MLFLRNKLSNSFAYQLLTSCRLAAPRSEEEYRVVGLHLSLGLCEYLANRKAVALLDSYKKAYECKDFAQADLLLAECHILGSTFKALFSWSLVNGALEMAFKSSRGPFVGSGLLPNFMEHVPAVTY
jgi:hypothetical protein